MVPNVRGSVGRCLYFRRSVSRFCNVCRVDGSRYPIGLWILVGGYMDTFPLGCLAGVVGRECGDELRDPLKGNHRWMVHKSHSLIPC